MQPHDQGPLLRVRAVLVAGALVEPLDQGALVDVEDEDRVEEVLEGHEVA